MGCNANLDLSAAINDQPMDSACYANGSIIGVRGGRLFNCNATTGAINFSTGTNVLPDLSPLMLSPASIVFTSVAGGRCFVVAWNTGNINTTTGLGVRKIFRVIPSSLLVDLVLDIPTMFGINVDPTLQAGIAVLKADGTNVYGMGNITSSLATVFKFDSTNPLGSNSHRTFGGEYPSFAEFGDVVFWNSVGSQDVESWNFSTLTHLNGPLDNTHNRLAIEYAPNVNRLYITEEFQFIDVYDTGGNFILQINTGRTNFNGVNIKYNSVNQLLYIAGGSDNSVFTINPVSNTLSTVKTGFDLPFDFVFTPTAAFAVQQGATPLKQVI